jgi:hypothetical protein
MDAAAPRPLKVSDSDPDVYFNDEDNDAILALVDDSAMQGVIEPLMDTVWNVHDGACDANRNAARKEPPIDASGTLLQVATTSVRLQVNRSLEARLKDYRRRPTAIGPIRSPCRTFVER